MDAVLVLNKPVGLTSRQVAARVGRLTDSAKAGHAGTLDPLATGVLVVCVGRATLLTSYLAGGAKRYRTGALLGVETTTYDIQGEVVERLDASRITRSEIDSALEGLSGRILQVPPRFSAVRRDGMRLYEYARKGVEIPLVEREVSVESIDIESVRESSDGTVVTLDITCGPGTYVRSLVHDLGQSLGCGACVESLERTSSGTFRIEESVTLDELESSRAEEHAMTMEQATSMMPAVRLDVEGATAVSMGKPLPSGTPGLPVCDGVFRVLDASERLIALYGPKRPDDSVDIAARAVRVLRPYTQGSDDEAA